jgi:3-methyl-2-oxobutanoate hydroxymethyltransferase
MPFLSYQVSVSQAVDNAGRLLKEAGADAVKIEGGSIRRETVRALVANGIPVMGHIGLTPQSVHQMGGYRLQGRTAAEARGLLEDARALEEAGVFCIVLECIPAALGADITKSVAVPTLGIGAGPHCDGQVLVTADLLGLTAGPSPRFVKRYADLGTETARAFESFRHDVSSGAFPGPEHSYQPVAS